MMLQVTILENVTQNANANSGLYYDKLRDNGRKQNLKPHAKSFFNKSTLQKCSVP